MHCHYPGRQRGFEFGQFRAAYEGVRPRPLVLQPVQMLVQVIQQPSSALYTSI
ncbi:MAG TPA: hypothetical protein VFU49_24245 [Ktedonobacteraceae bacterium]|nr:hypothetical protein [Ktedonobacteraceae bacterium]